MRKYALVIVDMIKDNVNTQGHGAIDDEKGAETTNHSGITGVVGCGGRWGAAQTRVPESRLSTRTVMGLG